MRKQKKQDDDRVGDQGRQGIESGTAATFQQPKVISDDLVALRKHNTRVKLNKPIYVGMTVLELSKRWMYTLWYELLKKRTFKDQQVNLVLTDTDSFVIEVVGGSGSDAYKDLLRKHWCFDFSNYPPDSKHNKSTVRDENKKVPGKLKDELGSVLMTEVCGLRAKQWAYVTAEKDEHKTCKGINKSTIAKELTLDMYKQAVSEHRVHTSVMTSIRSSEHELSTRTVTKVALSPFDDKRYILQDGINTLPYGHRDI